MALKRRILVVLAVCAGALIAAHGASSAPYRPLALTDGGWSRDAAQNASIADRPGDQVQPKLAAAANGTWYVSWYDNSAGGYDPALQRLDGLGVEAWPHNVGVVADTTLSFTADYGLAVDAGGGGRDPLVIFDAGTLQYGNFPPFLADGAGGAVFVWYETDPVLQTRVQHVRPDGTLRLPHDGLLVAAPSASIERVEPVGAYDPATDDIYAFWRETPHAGPLAQALWGQRIAGEGELAWGTTGVAVEPPAEHEVTQLEAGALAGDVLVAYEETIGQGDQRIWIRRLDDAERAATARVRRDRHGHVRASVRGRDAVHGGRRQ